MCRFKSITIHFSSIRLFLASADDAHQLRADKNSAARSAGFLPQPNESRLWVD